MSTVNNLKISSQILQLSAIGKIIVPIPQDSDHDELNSFFQHVTGLDTLRTFESFEGRSGEVWRVLHDSGELILVGLGKKPTPASAYKVLRKFSNDQRKNLEDEIGFFIDSICMSGDTSDIAQQLLFCEFAVNGLFTGTNTIRLNGDDNEHPLRHLILLKHQQEETSIEISEFVRAGLRGLTIAKSQLTSMQLINTPANLLNPLQFTDTVIDIARKSGFHCEVYDEKRLREEHFDALLAVNRGSEHPARFLVLEYDGTEQDFETTPLITLVGKGVTYDTGGLSMKPSESMVHMKCDMAGAAIVVSVMEALANLKSAVRVMATIPLTDNLVDSKSIKPGDVIRSYSGKSIEVIDTDAEGRLILADAISWVTKNTSSDYIIDIATLTGACVRTFGTHCAAIFSSSSDAQSTFMSVAERTGERLWPLPLWDLYKDDIQSDIADVRNYSGKPVAGSITAAKFLEYFTENHPGWVHLDVAGTVFGDTEFGKQKNATGYGVRLLTDTVLELSRKKH